MPIAYDSVVPWGRSFDEYRRMFALTDADLTQSILGCGDGPAAFNAGMRKRGCLITSVDPLYQFSRAQIAQRIEAVYAVVIEQTRNNSQLFNWVAPIEDINVLGRVRMAAMREFLEDYQRGQLEQRYVNAELPKLPFADGQFDLVLCSHFLFMYSDHLDQSFHQQSVVEMCRVGREVRIFPIVDCNGKPSPHVEPVRAQLGEEYSVQSVPVDYEFQIGANRMLQVTHR